MDKWKEFGLRTLYWKKNKMPKAKEFCRMVEALTRAKICSEDMCVKTKNHQWRTFWHREEIYSPVKRYAVEFYFEGIEKPKSTALSNRILKHTVNSFMKDVEKTFYAWVGKEGGKTMDKNVINAILQEPTALEKAKIVLDSFDFGFHETYIMSPDSLKKEYDWGYKIFRLMKQAIKELQEKK